MKTLFLSLFLTAVLMLHLPAQNKLSIENVRSIYLRNSGEILDGEELKGYFSFYVSDKIDKRTNEYTLQIIDNNLNKVKDIKFEDDKDISILESSYNGTSIMFLFYNKKEKTLEYRAYNFDGKVVSTYTKDLNRRSQALLEQTYGEKSEEGSNEALFSVGNYGYTTVYPVKEGKYYSYEINFFFSDRKKQWTYEAAEEQEDKYCTALYLGNTDSIVIFEVLKQKKLSSAGQHSWILGLNIFTGKKVFESITEGEENKFYPMNIAPINGTKEFLLLGTYYEPDSKLNRDASLGLAAWRLNTSGTVLSKKINPWDGAIGKYLPVDKKGRVADVGYIFFHKIIQTDDGKFFAIGEGYKKVVSALGMAGNILMATRGGSGFSSFKIKIGDLVMIEFNDKFDINNASIYDKHNNSMELPNGFGVLSPHTMALVAKAWGGFDYAFTKSNNEHSRFSIGYDDYEKSDDYKGRTFNSISYADGKITTDKIQLSSKAKWMRVLPAKAGFVAILEYFKKEKRLEYHLEKLN